MTGESLRMALKWLFETEYLSHPHFTEKETEAQGRKFWSKATLQVGERHRGNLETLDWSKHTNCVALGICGLSEPQLP